MLGCTAPFVAKKALEQSRRLGSTRIAEAINLIAAADLDVGAPAAWMPRS